MPQNLFDEAIIAVCQKASRYWHPEIVDARKRDCSDWSARSESGPHLCAVSSSRIAETMLTRILDPDAAGCCRSAELTDGALLAGHFRERPLGGPGSCIADEQAPVSNIGSARG